MWLSPQVPVCSFLRCVISWIASEEVVVLAGAKGGPGTASPPQHEEGGFGRTASPCTTARLLPPSPRVLRGNKLGHLIQILLPNIPNLWENNMFLIFFLCRRAVILFLVFSSQFCKPKKTASQQRRTRFAFQWSTQEVPRTRGLHFCSFSDMLFPPHG